MLHDPVVVPAPLVDVDPARGLGIHLPAAYAAYGDDREEEAEANDLLAPVDALPELPEALGPVLAQFCVDTAGYAARQLETLAKGLRDHPEHGQRLCFLGNRLTGAMGELFGEASDGGDTGMLRQGHNVHGVQGGFGVGAPYRRARPPARYDRNHALVADAAAAAPSPLDAERIAGYRAERLKLLVEALVGAKRLDNAALVQHLEAEVASLLPKPQPEAAPAPDVQNPKETPCPLDP